MKIKGITLTNFKSCRSGEYKFGKYNIVTGANGVGKSSILEGIVYVLTNKTSMGTTGVDRYITNGKSKMRVDLDIEGIGMVTRGINNGKGVLMVNGDQVTNSSFESRYCVEINYLMGAICPEYWKSMLYGDRRKLVMGLLPEVDRNEVFVKMFDREDLRERFQMESYAEVNASVRSLEGTIQDKNGRVAQIISEIEEVKNVEGDEVEFSKLEKYQELKEKIENESVIVKELEKLKVEKEEELQIDKKVEKAVQDLSENQEELEVHRRESTALENLKVELELGIEKTGTVDKIEAVLDITNQRLIQIRKNLDKCPVCDKKYNPSKMIKDLEREIKDFEIKLQKAKGQRDELQAMELKIASIDHNIRKAQEIIDQSENIIELAQDRKEKSLDPDIAKLTKRLITDNDRGEYSDLDKQYTKFKVDQGIMKDKQKRLKRLKEEGQENKKQIESDKVELTNLKVLSEALSPKGVDAEIIKTKTKVLEGYIERYANGVRIETIQDLKSGTGVKQVFNITKMGVSESQLSTGEKMKLAVAFSLGIQDLVKKQLHKNIKFLMIDDASLITDTDVFLKVIGDRQLIVVKNTDSKEVDIKVQS